MTAIKKIAACCFVSLLVLSSSISFASNNKATCSQITRECSIDDWLSAPESITMCFQGLDISCDNGLQWTKIFDAKKIGGVEIDIINLERNTDLSKIKGLKFGTLNKNTSYTCARAFVSSVIITPENGIPCNANKIIEEEGVNLASMYIRGTDACPGEQVSPTFIPFETTDSSTIDLVFGGEISSEGLPKFTLKPVVLEDQELRDFSNIDVSQPFEIEDETAN